MFEDIRHNEELQVFAYESYVLLLVKFVSATALHLMLHPEVAKMLRLMKYVTNHNEYFTHPNIAFCVIGCAFLTNCLTEIINGYLLLYQPTVEYSIIHFVALEVIVEIPSIYTAATSDNLNAMIFEDSVLRVYNRGSAIDFSSRSFSNKI